MADKKTSKKTSKIPSVEERIIGGLTEFRDALRDGDGAAHFTVRTVELDLHPQEYGPESVKGTRRILEVSQAIFAQLLGVSKRTVQAWEQGDNNPSNIAARFMDEFRANPDHWKRRLLEASVERETMTNCATASK